MGKVSYIITKGIFAGAPKIIGETKTVEKGIFIYIYPKTFIGPEGVFLGENKPFKFHFGGEKAIIPTVELGGKELPIYSGEKFIGTLYGSPATIGISVFSTLLGGKLHFAYFPS